MLAKGLRGQANRSNAARCFWLDFTLKTTSISLSRVLFSFTSLFQIYAVLWCCIKNDFLFPVYALSFIFISFTCVPVSYANFLYMEKDTNIFTVLVWTTYDVMSVSASALSRCSVGFLFHCAIHMVMENIGLEAYFKKCDCHRWMPHLALSKSI